jgi:hypothetical protein
MIRPLFNFQTCNRNQHHVTKLNLYEDHFENPRFQFCCTYSRCSLLLCDLTGHGVDLFFVPCVKNCKNIIHLRTTSSCANNVIKDWKFWPVLLLWVVGACLPTVVLEIITSLEQGWCYSRSCKNYDKQTFTG